MPWAEGARAVGPVMSLTGEVPGERDGERGSVGMPGAVLERASHSSNWHLSLDQGMSTERNLLSVDGFHGWLVKRLATTYTSILANRFPSVRRYPTLRDWQDEIQLPVCSPQKH
jgi:hypothetical protein